MHCILHVGKCSQSTSSRCSSSKSIAGSGSCSILASWPSTRSRPRATVSVEKVLLTKLIAPPNVWSQTRLCGKDGLPKAERSKKRMWQFPAESAVFRMNCRPLSTRFRRSFSAKTARIRLFPPESVIFRLKSGFFRPNPSKLFWTNFNCLITCINPSIFKNPVRTSLKRGEPASKTQRSQRKS